MSFKKRLTYQHAYQIIDNGVEMTNHRSYKKRPFSRRCPSCDKAITYNYCPASEKAWKRIESETAHMECKSRAARTKFVRHGNQWAPNESL
jgi:hypothetical protein